MIINNENGAKCSQKSNENDDKQHILLVGSVPALISGSFQESLTQCDFHQCDDLSSALTEINRCQYSAIVMDKQNFSLFGEHYQHVLDENMLTNIPFGFALVDVDQKILWCNRQFGDWCNHDDLNKIVGVQFYASLGRPSILGPDFCPLRTVRYENKTAYTLLFQKETGRYFHLDASPVYQEDGSLKHILVGLRDITEQQIGEIKWGKLRDAGKELADLSKEDIHSLSDSERVDILRAKIAKYAKEILQFDTIEIRIISEKKGRLLEPLLAIGMTEEAMHRVLYARQEDNGITGWVAFHGKNYRMEEPSEDQFYISGMPGAQSSITAPLIHHGKVIGTFNVESQKKKAFNDSDLPLLEYFASDVAQAIHTLDLLVSEQKDSAYRSLEMVYSDSVAPLNHILNLCAELLRTKKNHSPELLVDALQEIQSHTREIQSVFQKHGEEIVPDLSTTKSLTDCNNYPMLRNKRILMVDTDESVGRELSRLLFYYGCVVETATTGESALKMLETTKYDAILSDITLQDMSAFLFFKEVQCFLCREHTSPHKSDLCCQSEERVECSKSDTPFIPFIFMRAFGYDTGHVTTRAKQAGVIGFIFKPFILSQLLDTLKLVIMRTELS
ncbi:MAG: GAF domain-containing protein [Thermoguttaceae bacterium]